MNTAASFNSIGISRLGNTNYEITTYTFLISQPSPLEASAILLITFPSDIIPSVSSVCSITSPSSSTLSCSLSSLTLSIILPNS